MEKVRNGWVPLWRKAIDNKIRRHDPTAWRVFETLLLLVDQDTGKWSGGRFQLAAQDGSLTPGTIYKALKRLEKAKMVTLVSNNKYTVITICNLTLLKHPSNTPGNNKVTTKEQQSNTLTTINNQQSTKVTTNVVTKNPEVEEVITAFKSQVGRMRRERYQAAAASKLLGEYGRERTLAAVGAVVASRGRPYAPGITNLEDLWDKWPNLESYFRRESGKANKVLEV